MGRLSSPPTTPTQDPLVGQTLAGKYEIIERIGEGGMGSVYRAKQMPIDRTVAVKVLLQRLASDEIAVKRFEQEARAVSKMRHPNTVTVFDYGRTTDGRLYLVMEYLDGETLTQAMRRNGPLDPERTVHIIRQVCASLEEAHSAGIIHRDLKPDNIYLTEVGGDPNFVKVLDFGVAKLAGSDSFGTLTQTGMIFGTPKYMSPEQAEGRPIDRRSDIYAIGVVLFEMLTGRPPFTADTAVALLVKHISEPPPRFCAIVPESALPARLEHITLRALSKLPDERYDAALQLADDLSGCVAAAGPQLSHRRSPSASRTIPHAALSGTLPGDLDPGADPAPDTRPDAVPVMGATAPVPREGGQYEAFGGVLDMSRPIEVPRRNVAMLAIAGALFIGAVAFAISSLSPAGDGRSAPLVDTSGAPPKAAETLPPETTAQLATPTPAPLPAETSTPPPSPAPAVAKPAVAKVRFRFRSTPPGAAVFLDGRRIGVTPFTRRFRRQADEWAFSFRRKGFMRAERSAFLTADRVVEAVLLPAPRRKPLQPEPSHPLDEKVGDLKGF